MKSIVFSLFSHVMSTINNLGRTSGGLGYSVINDAKTFQILLNALAKKDLVNILNAPRLLVLDNQEATINIGNEVPSLVTQTQINLDESDSAKVYSSIEYRQTGIDLNIRPTINSNGVVTIAVVQNVSEADSNTTSQIDSPTFLNRSLKTTVVLEHGQTAILGGFIRNTKGNTNTSVPFLGDIPVIGHFFKSTSESIDKTELFIQITPYILDSPSKTQEITEKFKSLLEMLGK